MADDEQDLSNTSAWQTSTRSQLQMLTTNGATVLAHAGGSRSIVQSRQVAPGGEQSRHQAIKPDAQGIRLSVAFRLQQWLRFRVACPNIYPAEQHTSLALGRRGPTPHILVRSAGVSLQSSSICLMSCLVYGWPRPRKSSLTKYL